MFQSLKQTGAVLALSMSGLRSRRVLVLSTLFATALVVAVLLLFLAMAQGFQQTLRNASSNEIALFFRAGAMNEGNGTIPQELVAQIGELPGIEHAANTALISPELFIIVNGKPRSGSLDSNLALRGLGAEGLALRPGVRFVQGRMFAPGTNEIVVGRGLQREFAGLELGNTVHFGASSWKVVGVMAAGGSAFESEVWGDYRAVQRAFERGDTFQVVRARLDSAASLRTVRESIKASRLDLDVMTERGYQGMQAAMARQFLLVQGWSLALVMAIGALIGTVQVMSGSIRARARQIATLRALGFRRLPVFLALLLESLALALASAGLAALIVYFFFDGASASTLGNSMTKVMYEVTMSSDTLKQAALFALCIGLLAGLFPAQRAARAPLAAGMRA